MAKQKMKTRRSAAKRLKITKNGKVVAHHAWKSHLLRKKNAKRKRRLRKPTVVAKCSVRHIERLLPYCK